MYSKIFLLTVLLVGVNCRYILDTIKSPTGYIIDSENIIEDDLEDLRLQYPHYVPVEYNIRHRRQAHGVVNTNPDGSTNIMAKLPLAGNDKNVLSAIGGVDGIKPGGSFGAASAGLALDNVNRHGLSLTGKHIPDLGDQLTAAGKANLFHNDHHDVSANAFATRTFPNNPAIPNFNTVGGGVGYTYNDKIGASLGMAHTDLFKRTDYSAMGNLNVFRNPTSSLDLSAGLSKSVSPFIPHSSWQPSAGLTFSKYF